MKKIATLVCVFFITCYCHAQIITTVAGGDTLGLGDGGPAINCKLAGPIGIATDASGNIYIADRDHNRIRKINGSGIITTIAGTGVAGFSGDGGSATLAKINTPLGIAIDAIGNIYISDVYNHRIRKIDILGTITTIAGNGTAGYNGDNISATSAQLNFPHGVAVDQIGNVYVADFKNNRIRKINSLGVIATCAGTGTGGFNGDSQPATSAQIFQPFGISVDASNNLYIADITNGRVRKVNPSGNITTVAGNGSTGSAGDGGQATNASIAPTAMTLDGYGNMYIVDAGNNFVRKVNPSGIINTIAGVGVTGYNGDNIPATQAKLFNPTGIAVDASANILIADFGNNRIRHINSTVSVNDIAVNKGRIAIYPNPCSGQFNATIASDLDEDVMVGIFNLSGQKVKDFAMRTNRPLELTIDVPSGIYFIYVTSQSKTWSEKVHVLK